MKSDDRKKITAEQLRDARRAAGMTAQQLADAAKVGVATVRRSETDDGEIGATYANSLAMKAVLEGTGVVFGGRHFVRKRFEPVQYYDDRVLYDVFEEPGRSSYLVREFRERNGVTADIGSPQTFNREEAERWLMTGDWPNKEPE